MRKIIFILLCLLLLSGPASATPTLEDLKLSLPGDVGTISFYGQSRFRWHLWDYFSSDPYVNSYDYYSHQLKLGTRLENSALQAHAAWQYTQAWLLPTGTSPGAGSGSLYFSNGTGDNETHGSYLKYAEIHLKDITGFGWTAGGGRMDYSSGNRYVTGTGRLTPQAEANPRVTKQIQWLKSTRIADRMIGGFGWSEYQRSFDGGYGSWDHENFNIQFAAMNPTQGGFDENANHTIYDIDLMASELTLKRGALFPDTEFQVFYYSYSDSREMTSATPRRDNTGRTVPSGLEYDVDVRMIGGHLVGAADLGAGILDYFVWGGYQFGDWFELDHSAYAVAAEAGFQWTDLPWKPWIRGGYNMGSGDSNPSDGDHGTFYQMLPTARLYSFSILYNMMNTEDAFVSVILKPADPLTVRSDIHWVSLAENKDRWYLGAGEITDGNAAGYAVRPSSGEDRLGTLVDVSASYKICPSATVSVYYGHFFGSDVVEQFYRTSQDADFFYAEFTLKF